MLRRATRPALAALVPLAAAAVLLTPAVAQGATRTVAVANNVFSPRTTTIDVGDMVKWVWRSSGRTHNVTSRSFRDSGDRSSGSFSVRFGRAGRFGYVCTLHSGMTGTVVVRR